MLKFKMLLRQKRYELCILHLNIPWCVNVAITLKSQSLQHYIITIEPLNIMYTDNSCLAPKFLESLFLFAPHLFSDRALPSL